MKAYRKTMRAIGALTLSLILSSCALLTHGRHQLVGFSSEPASAKVTVDGQEYGVTPVYVKLERKYDHAVVIELDGFQPYKATLTRKVSGWAWGNIVFGGIIGLVVDHATGALYRLEPWQMSAVMGRAGQELNSSADGILVLLVPEAEKEWTQVGLLTRR
jgi:hypothetical protein